MTTFRKVSCYASENAALQLYKSIILPIIVYIYIIYSLVMKQQKQYITKNTEQNSQNSISGQDA